MHFSQGWVQFGYRFSNDFAPFLLLLVAVGMERLGGVRPSPSSLGLSIAVNLWASWDHPRLVTAASERRCRPSWTG
jgi:hypothetical protein